VEMGAPARNRLASSIWDNLRIGVKGMLVRDVPQALESLGFSVPPRLAAAIQKRRSESVEVGDDSRAVAPAVGVPLEESITKEQWLKLVQKYVMRERALRQLDGEDEGEEDDEDCGTGIGGVEAWRGEVWADEPKIRIERPGVGNSSSAARARGGQDYHDHGWSEEKKASPTRSRPVSDPYSRNSPSKASLRGGGGARVRETYTSQLRKVQSRIGDSVKRDKLKYMAAHQASDREALKTIAKERVETIMSFPPAGARGRDQQRNSRKGPSRLSDLSSGAAALEIASSFLKGPVGAHFVEEMQADLEEEIEKNKNATYFTASADTSTLHVDHRRNSGPMPPPPQLSVASGMLTMMESSDESAADSSAGKASWKNPLSLPH